MKSFVKIQTILVILIPITIYNCSRKIDQHVFNSISPPFEKINVAFSENIIDPSEGGQIKFENGTKITIPENAFVDLNGKPVKSKVKINYREFHSGAQIVMSGIPMKYGKENFQTAGMFEISGNTDNNETVQLAANKLMKVQMASFATGDNYDFYYFDENQGAWILKGSARPEENKEKQSKINSLPEIQEAPTMPVRQQEKSLVFDLEVNTSLYPEFKGFNNVVWQYAGTNQENNPEKTPWVFTEKWSFVELKKINESEMKYDLHLRSITREFNTVVAPVLNAKNYREALKKFESNVSLYNTALQIRKTEEERLSKEANLLRTFEVNNFGIYNWDCFYKNNDKMITLDAEFKLNEEVAGLNLDNIKMYLITGNKRAVIPYYTSSRQNFMFNPNDDNILIAILPGDRIAVFRNEDFNSLVNSNSLSNNSRYTFILKVVNDQVITAENFTEMLSSI